MVDSLDPNIFVDAQSITLLMPIGLMWKRLREMARPFSFTGHARDILGSSVLGTLPDRCR